MQVCLAVSCYENDYNNNGTSSAVSVNCVYFERRTFKRLERYIFGNEEDIYLTPFIENRKDEVLTKTNISSIGYSRLLSFLHFRFVVLYSHCTFCGALRQYF